MPECSSCSALLAERNALQGEVEGCELALREAQQEHVRVVRVWNALEAENVRLQCEAEQQGRMIVDALNRGDERERQRDTLRAENVRLREALTALQEKWRNAGRQCRDSRLLNEHSVAAEACLIEAEAIYVECADELEAYLHVPAGGERKDA